MEIRTTILNCPVDLLDIEQATTEVKKSLDEKRNFHIVTLNPEMVMKAQEDKAFFDIINNSDLNIAEGAGTRIALKIKGITQHRIRGIDFARHLIELASENNLPIGLLGAKEEVIVEAKNHIKEKYPSLNIAYIRNGYFNDDEEIIKEIKKANPKILLVGLGSPKQEEIISKLKKVLDGTVMIGVGGSFDVFSGTVKESPMIFRRLGLEWLYRTLCQPERFKRIFPTLPIFLLKCIIETVGSRK